jgi:hypothetical protein
VPKTILIFICITLAGNASFAETEDSSGPLYPDITGDEVFILFRSAHGNCTDRSRRFSMDPVFLGQR